jgi:hypothetical protein
LHRGEYAFNSVIEFTNEHSRLSLRLLVLGQVYEGNVVLHQFTTPIPNRADGNGGPKVPPVLSTVVNFRILTYRSIKSDLISEEVTQRQSTLPKVCAVLITDGRFPSVRARGGRAPIAM